MSLPTTTPTNASTTTKVLVLGKLGELVKKIYELEYIISRRPNPIIASELASYNMVLAAWPVEDAEAVRIQIAAFKLQLDKFHSEETRFKAAVAAKVDLQVQLASFEYLKALQTVRETLKRLNGMGKHIGNSIWLEIKP